MKINSQLLLQVPTPPPNLNTDARLDNIFRATNRSLDAISAIVLQLAGFSGPIQENSDIDMQGHAIHNLADPKLPPDAANKNYVDAQIKAVQQLIAALRELLHNLVITNEVIYLTRALPTVVGDTIEIGTFTSLVSAHNIDIAITVDSVGFSVAKRYFLPVRFTISAGWQLLQPLSDTGAYIGEDFALEVNQDDANNQLHLRLRRTAGVTAGIAIVHMQQIGSRADHFVPTSATATPAAVTTFFPDGFLSENTNNLVMNCLTPIMPFAGWSTLTISGTTKGGAIELITQDTDADGLAVGNYEWADKNATGVEKRPALIEGVLQGATANNRGGQVRIWTKADNGALAQWVTVDNVGNLFVGGATTIGTAAAKAVAVPNGTSPTGSVAGQSTVLGKANGAGNSQPIFREEGNTTTDRFVAGNSVVTTAGAVVRAISGSGALGNFGYLDILASNGLIYQIPCWTAV